MLCGIVIYQESIIQRFILFDQQIIIDPTHPECQYVSGGGELEEVITVLIQDWGMVKWVATGITLFIIYMLNCFCKTNKSFQWGSNIHPWYRNMSRVYSTENWIEKLNWKKLSICLWWGWTGGGDYGIDPRLGNGEMGCNRTTLFTIYTLICFDKTNTIYLYYTFSRDIEKKQAMGCPLWLVRPSHQWGQVTHICVSNLNIIGSDNGLLPGRHQAIIWTNAGILLTGPLGTNFNEILIEIHTFSLKEMHLKMSSAKWRPFCHSLNGLKWRKQILLQWQDTVYFDGLVQDCSNSIANALELLQSCTKPSIYLNPCRTHTGIFQQTRSINESHNLWVLLVACCELVGDYSSLSEKLCVFEHHNFF